VRPPVVGQITPTDEREALQYQKGVLESQLKSLQETFERIERRLSEIEESE
jgi:prefoldin subunit 5